VLDAVVVATDAEEIVDVCRSFGADVVLTSSDHPSGTDRVAEVIGVPAWAGYDVIANVQGDEPFVREDHVAAAVEAVRQGWEVGTVATPVGSLEAWLDPSVVKVARRQDGAALYFSRAPIPHRRDAAPQPEELRSEPYLRHIGVYAYRREALLRWTKLPEAPLERIERLEQLRPLSAGMGIGVAVVGAAEGGVDTPEDARRAEARLGLSTEA
jgi:3-deoxy-manno-octulosonate cytidylyltransferase (CMP-KDO synthetase)